jgi:hypothetical protein
VTDGRLEEEAARRFLLAGRAVCTAVGRTRRFTFRVIGRRDPLFPDVPVERWTVEVLAGPDNGSDYRPIGQLRRWHQALDRVRFEPGTGAPAARAFAWLWQRLEAGEAIDPAVLYHARACGRCGRELTTPESVRTGLGPVCATRAP